MKLPDLKKLNRRKIKEFLLPVALLYLCLHIFLFANQRYFMYSPATRHITAAVAGVPEMMAIAVNPADMNESIEGWYKSPADTSKPVILYFHGDGGGIADRAAIAQRFIKQGYGVLLAGYRGFSGNPGSPSEEGFYKDGEAYIDWLKNQENIPVNRIILYGESLGSGIVTELASKHLNIAGMIIDGGFSSLTDVNRRAMPGVLVSLIFFDRYDSMSRINSVVCPILVLHGAKDSTVSLKLAQKLYDAANQPKTMKIYAKGGHGNLYNFGAMDDVATFIAGLKRS